MSGPTSRSSTRTAKRSNSYPNSARPNSDSKFQTASKVITPFVITGLDPVIHLPSIKSVTKWMDARIKVRARRAVDAHPHCRDANRVRALQDNVPRKIEGAGKAGCSASTRSLACEIKKHTRVVTTGSPKQSGLPCAMVYDLFRALPGDRALLPPSPAELLPPT